MSFLDKNSSEYLSARLTQKGRNAIAKGDFKISHFAIGDSEYVYGGFSGSLQSVFTPMDKDSDIKYPLSYESGSLPYGVPITGSTYTVVTNQMGSAGFISGSVIESLVVTGNITSLTGANTLTLTKPSSGVTFSNAEYITLVLGTLNTDTITGYSNNLVYKILSISGNTTTEILTLDRPTPDFNSRGLTGNFTVIANNANIEFPTISDPSCLPPIPDPSEQHDPWTLSSTWGKKPIGFASTDDEPWTFNKSNITLGITYASGSNHISTKEFLGYHSNAGQYYTDSTGTIITGTTFTNSFGELIEIPSSEQDNIAIIHYSEVGDLINDPDRAFKYDDYISTDTNFFEIYIPYIDYHRNTGTTIGAKFYMGSADKYMVSKINPTKMSILYRDLLDEQGIKVGKIFVNNKVIVFDDKELAAVLDIKSNRRYTLPTPKLELTHSTDGSYVLDGTTGKTLYVSYVFSYSTDTKLNGLPCMNYTKITLAQPTSEGCAPLSSAPSNVVVKFTGSTLFDALKPATSGLKTGFVANEMYILAQITSNNSLPSSNGWKKIPVTLTLNGDSLISPSSVTGLTFTITNTNYSGASSFTLSGHTGQSYSGATTQFGEEQPFAGSVKLTRASRIEEMNFLVNLPSGKFATSQNPTYVSGNPKVTEVALLDSNKNALVIAKTGSPISRSGTQVFAVKLDF
jgi:hypothetical protein